METIQYVIRAALAALAGLWHALPQLARFLFVLMLVDVALSIAIAIRDRDINVAVKASTDKVAYVAMVAIAAYVTPALEPHLGINLAQAAASFYLVPVAASVTQRASLLGVPAFPQLQTVLDTFSKAHIQTK